jgi:hypothetical protein
MLLPSPSTTASPSTPFTPLQPTPKARHSKSLSGDLAREYRPLYLVEKTMKTPDVEGDLPPLPESASTSRTPSVNETDDESFHSAAESPEASFHGSFDEQEPSFHTSFEQRDMVFGDHDLSYEPDDLLDSQQTTPKAVTFPAGVMGLPSRRDSDDRGLAAFDTEETPKKSREPSPSGLGLGELTVGATLGAASGLAAYKSLSAKDEDAKSAGSSRARDLDDFMGGDDDDAEVEDEEYQRQVAAAARRNAKAEADAEAERERLAKLAKSTSKKGKKGKRGSKASFDDVPATLELTVEQLREKDAADALDSWFEPSASAKKGKPSKDFDDYLPNQAQDETVFRAKIIEHEDDMDDDASTLVASDVTYRKPAHEIKEQVAAVSKVPDVLLQRTPKQKGKKKGKKGSKSGSISLDKGGAGFGDEIGESGSVVESSMQDVPGKSAAIPWLDLC